MTKIKSPNYTSWGNSNESVKQPNNINYNQLFEKLSQKEKQEKEKSQVKDLRTLSKQSAQSHTHNEITDSVEKIDKKSIIPVPGLMVQHENSESDWQPSSEWHTPHGVHWGQ